MRRLLLLAVLVLSAFPTSRVQADQQHDEKALQQAYDALVQSLNRQSIAQGYPEAVRKLDSADPAEVVAGLKILGATDDPAAIPFIAPFVDSQNADIQIYAGLNLEHIVSTYQLKRRDREHLDRVVIKPPAPGELDLKPVAWIILKMLRAPDDGNNHAYAATMIGYLGLKDFEGDLRTLLQSRHPAVTNAAQNALEVLGLETTPTVVPPATAPG